MARARSLWQVPVWATLLLLASTVMMPRTVFADDDAALSSTPELQTLIDRHMPILMLKEQSHACDTLGEPYVAGPATLMLNNPVVTLRQDATAARDGVRAPTAADIEGKDATYFLDLPGDPLRAGCTYERLSKARMAELVPTANVHVAREEGRDGLVIQYWFLYLYNDFNNKHEGDWEMIQVVYNVNSVAEALATVPVAVGYAQHGGGEKADWDDQKFEQQDGHPVVYVSRGSHASQYDSALYLGWGENGTGFGCDITEAPSYAQPLSAILIADDTQAESRGVPWTTYEGHWGQRGPWEFDGPLGPNTSFKWRQPLTWQDGLRAGSLAVPTTQVLGPAPTEVFCRVSAASGDLFRIGAEQPLVAALYVLAPLSAFLTLLALSRHTLGRATLLYARNVRYFVWPAMMIIAIGVVSAVLHQVSGWMYDHSPLADFPFAWALFTVALSIAQPLVAIVVAAPPAIYAVARVRAHELPQNWKQPGVTTGDYRRMLRALYRPAVVIAGVSVLPGGALVAAYWFIRHIFIPQGVLLSGQDSNVASTSSLVMTRGRWLRVAALVATLTILMVIPSPIVGIALLIYFGQSVALVNLASSIIFALIIPFIFVALTLSYLDYVDISTVEKP